MFQIDQLLSKENESAFHRFRQVPYRLAGGDLLWLYQLRNCLAISMRNAKPRAQFLRPNSRGQSRHTAGLYRAINDENHVSPFHGVKDNYLVSMRPLSR